MPLKTWNTQSAFDTHYDVSGEPEGHPNTRQEVRLHYHRKVMMPWFRAHIPDLIKVLGLQTSHRIVIIGCAFGWSLEVFDELGFTNVVGTDTSSYIQTSKLLSEDTELNALTTARVPAGEVNSIVAKLSDRQAQPRSRLATRILNEPIANNSSRSRVRTAVGGTPHFTISEGVLESLTNAEARTLSTNMRTLGGTVVHRVTYPTSIAGYNTNTPEAWKTLLTPDLIVRVPEWTVL